MIEQQCMMGREMTGQYRSFPSMMGREMTGQVPCHHPSSQYRSFPSSVRLSFAQF